MKTKLLAALTFGGLLSIQGAQAQYSQPVGVQKVGDFSYRVWVSNPAARPGRLQLVSLRTGAVLYYETSSRVSFGQRFDVQRLPDGEYAFEVKLGPEKYRYVLNLSTVQQRTAELSAGPLPVTEPLVSKL